MVSAVMRHMGIYGMLWGGMLCYRVFLSSHEVLQNVIAHHEVLWGSMWLYGVLWRPMGYYGCCGMLWRVTDLNLMFQSFLLLHPSHRCM